MYTLIINHYDCCFYQFFHYLYETDIIINLGFKEQFDKVLNRIPVTKVLKNNTIKEHIDQELCIIQL